ncbi:unnamed protein product, partial [Allacma fusca]
GFCGGKLLHSTCCRPSELTSVSNSWNVKRVSSFDQINRSTE